MVDLLWKTTFGERHLSGVIWGGFRGCKVGRRCTMTNLKIQLKVQLFLACYLMLPQLSPSECRTASEKCISS